MKQRSYGQSGTLQTQCKPTTQLAAQISQTIRKSERPISCVCIFNIRTVTFAFSRCSTHYPSTMGTLINSASESSVLEAELTGLCNNNNNELQEEEKNHFRNLECKWAVSRKKDFTYTLLVYLYLYTKHLLHRFFLNTHKHTHKFKRDLLNYPFVTVPVNTFKK